jgi:hypothetical protein
MASLPTAPAATKPSFAKVRFCRQPDCPALRALQLTEPQVAASPYVPAYANQNTRNSNMSSDEPNPSMDSQNATAKVARPANPVGQNGAAEQPPASTLKEAQVENISASSRASQICTTSAGDPLPAEVLTKAPPTDDGSTQVSSSNSSAKLPSFDKQSIASGTTFALDEKESLRPDDSASIRAIDEEDVFSAPGTGATGSRVGSDTDARAFSEQLHQIAVMAPRGGHPPVTIMRPNITFGEMPMNMATPQPQNLTVGGVGGVAMPPIRAAPSPDEKLLEAIEAPRDRVYVLKIEQDILDFLNNDK